MSWEMIKFIMGYSSKRRIIRQNIKQQKEQIRRDLEQIEDIHLVEAIRNMLAYGKFKRYQNSLYPMTEEELFERNRISEDQIKKKELIDNDELKLYFKNKHA